MCAGPAAAQPGLLKGLGSVLVSNWECWPAAATQRAATLCRLQPARGSVSPSRKSPPGHEEQQLPHHSSPKRNCRARRSLEAREPRLKAGRACQPDAVLSSPLLGSVWGQGIDGAVKVEASSVDECQGRPTSSSRAPYHGDSHAWGQLTSPVTRSQQTHPAQPREPSEQGTATHEGTLHEGTPGCAGCCGASSGGASGDGGRQSRAALSCAPSPGMLCSPSQKSLVLCPGGCILLAEWCEQGLKDRHGPRRGGAPAEPTAPSTLGRAEPGLSPPGSPRGRSVGMSQGRGVWVRPTVAQTLH